MSNDLLDDDSKDKKKQTSDSLAVQNIMRNEDSREFIYGHLQSCGVFESIFSTDPVQLGYSSGMRDAGLLLLGEIKEAAPDDYLKMIRENL